MIFRKGICSFVTLQIIVTAAVLASPAIAQSVDQSSAQAALIQQVSNCPKGSIAIIQPPKTLTDAKSAPTQPSVLCSQIYDANRANAAQR